MDRGEQPRFFCFCPSTHPTKPYLPQVDYNELLTILAYIKDDYEDDPRGQGHPYVDLEAAHLLGMAWAGLYLGGVFTHKFLGEGVMMLWENQDYARCDIIDTILTTVLDGAPGANPDYIDIEGLIEFRDEVRAAKNWHANHIE